VCPSSAKANQTITCTVSVSGTPVATQGQLTITPTAGSPVLGTLTTPIANKQVAAQMGTNNIWLVYGMNQSTMPNGTMLSIQFVMPNSAVTVTIPQSSVYASDPNGGALTVTANPPATVALVSNCDINSDGVVNQADVDALKATILGNPPSATVNVQMLQKVQNAVDGLACTL